MISYSIYEPKFGQKLPINEICEDETLIIQEDLLIKYTSQLQEAYEEQKNCKTCEGIKKFFFNQNLIIPLNNYEKDTISLFHDDVDACCMQHRQQSS